MTSLTRTDFLTSIQLENIKKHEYKSTGYTVFDHVLDRYFWNQLEYYLPEHVSPNVITLLGVTSAWVGVLIINLYDTQMKGNLPTWVYCFQIVMLFNYMTFDALDGKQARRRSKLSKVGELLDHSGDAFSDAFMALIMAQALKLDTIFERLIILFSFQIMDFCMLWEQHITNLYHPHRNNIGLSENVSFAIFVVFSRIYFSDDFNYYLGKFAVVFYSYLLLSTIVLVLQIYKDCKDNSHVHKLSPLAIVIISQILQADLMIYHNYTLPMTIIGIFVYAFISAKFIVCNMSKSEFAIFDIDVFSYFLTVIICWVTNDVLLSGYALIIYSIILVFKYIRFMFSVINQILDYFNISF